MKKFECTKGPFHDAGIINFSGLLQRKPSNQNLEFGLAAHSHMRDGQKKSSVLLSSLVPTFVLTFRVVLLMQGGVHMNFQSATHFSDHHNTTVTHSQALCFVFQ